MDQKKSSTPPSAAQSDFNEAHARALKRNGLDVTNPNITDTEALNLITSISFEIHVVLAKEDPSIEYTSVEARILKLAQLHKLELIANAKWLRIQLEMGVDERPDSTLFGIKIERD